MGLFGKLFGGDEQQTQAPVANTPVQTSSTEGREVTLDLNKGGMLNLAKNDFLNLSKTEIFAYQQDGMLRQVSLALTLTLIFVPSFLILLAI